MKNKEFNGCVCNGIVDIKCGQKIYCVLRNQCKRFLCRQENIEIYNSFKNNFIMPPKRDCNWYEKIEAQVQGEKKRT